MKMLDDLAKKTLDGYISFTELVNNKDKEFGRGVIYDENNNRIVLDMLIDDIHEDIISYYDSPGWQQAEYTATVIFDEDDEPYIDIESRDNESIVVEDGRWYFC